MGIREVKSPSHATPRGASIGDSRGGHVARSPGKGPAVPPSLMRKDAEPVLGGGGVAELEKALDKGMARGDRR